MSNPRQRANSPKPAARSPPGGATAADTSTAPESAPPTSVSSPAPSEAGLLAQVQAGDHIAFAQLYSLHKKRIYSLCVRMVGNMAEAEDLTQETFLQLYRKISTFRGDSAFSTWLHRLAINVVLMHLRKKGLSLISMDEATDPPTEGNASRALALETSHCQARSTGSPSSARSATFPPATGLPLFSMTLRDMSIMR